MTAVYVALGLAILAANAPGWSTLLLWAACLTPLVALVIHLGGVPTRRQRQERRA